MSGGTVEFSSFGIAGLRSASDDFCDEVSAFFSRLFGVDDRRSCFSVFTVAVIIINFVLSKLSCSGLGENIDFDGRGGVAAFVEVSCNLSLNQ